MNHIYSKSGIIYFKKKPVTYIEHLLSLKTKKTVEKFMRYIR